MVLVDYLNVMTMSQYEIVNVPREYAIGTVRLSVGMETTDVQAGQCAAAIATAAVAMMAGDYAPKACAKTTATSASIPSSSSSSSTPAVCSKPVAANPVSGVATPKIPRSRL
jgi:type IV secretory pathway TrbL component